MFTSVVEIDDNAYAKRLELLVSFGARLSATKQAAADFACVLDALNFDFCGRNGGQVTAGQGLGHGNGRRSLSTEMDGAQGERNDRGDD